MNIAFYAFTDLCGFGKGHEFLEMGKMAVDCARLAMPNAHIIQLAHPTATDIGADQRIEHDEFNRAYHHSLVPKGNTVFLDVDMILLYDIEHVFEEDFDWAICVRQYQDVKNPDFDTKCFIAPVFSRDGEIWRQFSRFNGKTVFSDTTYPAFIKQAQEKGLFKFKFLPGEKYGYIPNCYGEHYDKRYLVHYKGDRKAWMFNPKDQKRWLGILKP